jgi:hypothetical protein
MTPFGAGSICNVSNRTRGATGADRATQRYMHLSPAALDSAIRLLDGTGCGKNFGDSGSVIRYLQSAV